MSASDLSQLSMQDLFRIEAENQVQALTAGLLILERSPTAPEQLEACMRAAHSVKGAARIVDVSAGVTLAHAMEDCFVAAQHGHIKLSRARIDLLLEGVDLLTDITNSLGSEEAARADEQSRKVDGYVRRLSAALAEVEEDAMSGSADAPAPNERTSSDRPSSDRTAPERRPIGADTSKTGTDEPPVKASPSVAPLSAPGAAEPDPSGEAPGRAIRVTVENLNGLLGLAGESMVDSRWLKPFGESLLRLKRLHRESAKAVDSFREAVSDLALDEQASAALTDLQRKIVECEAFLAERLAELEASDRHSTNIAHRLYDQALACRMRPFADGTLAFPRMVRDVAHTLGKQVRLEIAGPATQVDRDILEKLDAPLGHLLRNAIDHGIEMPEERLAAGKDAEGVISIEARHRAGMLQIIVTDDGRGIGLDALRQAIIRRGHSNAETVAKMSDSELLEFLFLPGFTMRETVTDISGRGVGLDAVQDMVRQVRGIVRISSEAGIGTRFQLELPLTLSVVRALLLEIGGESYALPLAHIVRTLKLEKAKIELLEGRQHFDFDGASVGLVAGHQVLDCAKPEVETDELSVVVLGDQNGLYGLVVDRFLGGRELVVHPLDPRLGKIKDISAAALLEDGSPTLIIDVDDMIRSMEKLAQAARLDRVGGNPSEAVLRPRKRVLVVDDSLTVRELERKLLDHRGYEVEVSIDGMDGWNAVRNGHFDLVVTDVDMPRMNGIELVSLIRQEPRLKNLPVMIVSYKDREEDRTRGLEAGADYYLAKSSFHDDTLLQAVADLIGEPQS